MEQVQGFEQVDPAKMACILIKYHYRPKQASGQWYSKLYDLLVKILGMDRNPDVNFVYVRWKGYNILLIDLYVDELLRACFDYGTVH